MWHFLPPAHRRTCLCGNTCMPRKNGGIPVKYPSPPYGKLGTPSSLAWLMAAVAVNNLAKARFRP